MNTLSWYKARSFRFVALVLSSVIALSPAACSASAEEVGAGSAALEAHGSAFIATASRQVQASRTENGFAITVTDRSAGTCNMHVSAGDVEVTLDDRGGALAVFRDGSQLTFRIVGGRYDEVTDDLELTVSTGGEAERLVLRGFGLDASAVAGDWLMALVAWVLKVLKTPKPFGGCIPPWWKR